MIATFRGIEFVVVILYSLALVIESERTMLSWMITFLLISLLAALLGFGALAGTAAFAAKICFFVFLVLFIVSAIMGRRMPSP